MLEACIVGVVQLQIQDIPRTAICKSDEYDDAFGYPMTPVF